MKSKTIAFCFLCAVTFTLTIQLINARHTEQRLRMRCAMMERSLNDCQGIDIAEGEVRP